MTTVRIRLNVGGTIFETTKSTLDKLGSGYFNRLLDPKSGFQQPADDKPYFIDADPDCFRIFLNIARYGQVLLSTNISPEALAKEADFYLLGSEPLAILLRYTKEQQKKEDRKEVLLKSILLTCQECQRELQGVKRATEELVRGMASQAYWSS